MFVTVSHFGPSLIFWARLVIAYTNNADPTGMYHSKSLRLSSNPEHSELASLPVFVTDALM